MQLTSALLLWAVMMWGARRFVYRSPAIIPQLVKLVKDFNNRANHYYWPTPFTVSKVRREVDPDDWFDSREV